MGTILKDIAYFLNSYSGLFLAILTGLYVLFTFKILKSNRDLINIMREERELDMRPYIIFKIEDRPEPMVYLQIKNIGKSAAQNVRISVDPDFKRFGSLNKLSDIAIFKEGILFFPPATDYTILLGNYNKFFKHKKQEAILPNVLYFKCEYIFQNKEYSEKSTVDIRSQSGTELPSNLIAKKIDRLNQDIKREIGSIAKHMFYFVKKDYDQHIKKTESSKKSTAEKNDSKKSIKTV